MASIHKIKIYNLHALDCTESDSDDPGICCVENDYIDQMLLPFLHDFSGAIDKVDGQLKTYIVNSNGELLKIFETTPTATNYFGTAADNDELDEFLGQRYTTELTAVVELY